MKLPERAAPGERSMQSFRLHVVIRALCAATIGLGFAVPSRSQDTQAAPAPQARGAQRGGATPSINPGNLVFYSGDAFPAWRGDMLMATMTRSLLRVDFDAAGNPGTQECMLTQFGQRLRDVRQGPEDLIYVLTDETGGAMLRIEPLR